MAGMKLFVNTTEQVLMVTLSVRKGGDPSNGNSSVLVFPLLPEMEHEQEYGDDSDIYLNAIRWSDEGRNPLGEVVVETRGDSNDDVMNTNSIMIFEGERPEIRLIGRN